MSLPSAREVYNKTRPYYPNGYTEWLEQQYKEMLGALIYEIDTVCSTCQNNHGICAVNKCHQYDKMKKAIESATGLPIEEAIG